MSQGPAAPRDLLEIEDGRQGQMIDEDGRTKLVVYDRNTLLLEHIAEQLAAIHALIVRLVES